MLLIISPRGGYDVTHVIGIYTPDTFTVSIRRSPLLIRHCHLKMPPLAAIIAIDVTRYAADILLRCCRHYYACHDAAILFYYALMLAFRLLMPLR